MRSFAALLAAYACVGVVGLINVEMHFESLCKQCQIHIAGMRDIVLRGGNESSLEEAGVKPWLNITIDYYGAIARDGTCESAAKFVNFPPFFKECPSPCPLTYFLPSCPPFE
mmetsp:Transcript_7453/g.12204  ORF Transcript_7453/g.12204 Transcript_7453/m.12204 type:complete len:112 (-) Transcript_7453:997-1332(-)